MANKNRPTPVVDITPSPRILRVLGDIPFLPWQCLAELVDNSIDAFLSEENAGDDEKEKKITIAWSNDGVGSNYRTVDISDNACGMTLGQLQNAVRAGYSSNDPINNLGLFGMGFNIATAKLGERTTICSTRKGDKNWVCLTIDFAKMHKAKSFEAPITYTPKDDPNESGTKICISHLKPGIGDMLITKENNIRKQLETIYTPLLNSNDIVINVKGKQLFPRNHCVWARSRYVMYNGDNIPARTEINRDLGESLFDLEKNRYLTENEAEAYTDISDDNPLPEHIVKRSKRLTGWLGIQRYADPNEYGIDFIRNGRKILISDKSLFLYENPTTGSKELQYPVELGGTIGGRIVGELNVDYLLPTYQKNDFDKTDSSWRQTISAICGDGPFLPKSRKGLGIDEANDSPLGILVSAYRRVDAGTKCLFAPNQSAKTWAKLFAQGKREYVEDEVWWKAAQEEDQKKITGGVRSTPVNDGGAPSDNIGDYLGTSAESTATTGVTESPKVAATFQPEEETTSWDSLLKHSEKVVQLSGKYGFGRTTPLSVSAYELNSGRIMNKGKEVPCLFKSEGAECTFVYNPSGDILSKYIVNPKSLLLVYLAEKIKARDNMNDLADVYSALVQSSMPEAKLDRATLQERALKTFDMLRDKLSDALKDKAVEVLQCVHESAGEVEETVNNILSDPTLLDNFQKKKAEGFDAITQVPLKTLIRLVDKFPELLFDGKVFSASYSTIALSDSKATERSRNESKDRVMSFLKDALRVAANSTYGQKDQKNELSRASLSIDFLMEELQG